MMELPWEQKLAALNALGECSLKMRAPGDWYASQHGVSVVEKHLEGGGAGEGSTPKGAVDDLWRQRVVGLPLSSALIVRGSSPHRCVRWNGFMWADVPRPGSSET